MILPMSLYIRGMPGSPNLDLSCTFLAVPFMAAGRRRTAPIHLLDYQRVVRFKVPRLPIPVYRR